MPEFGSVTPKAWRRSSPAGDVWQISPLLLVRAVPQQRSHDVHLRVTGAGVATGAVDCLQDDRPPRPAPSPSPPYSSGISAARKPASVIAWTNASGYPSTRSRSRQYSFGKRRHKLATSRRSSSRKAIRSSVIPLTFAVTIPATTSRSTVRHHNTRPSVIHDVVTAQSCGGVDQSAAARGTGGCFEEGTEPA